MAAAAAVFHILLGDVSQEDQKQCKLEKGQ